MINYVLIGNKIKRDNNIFKNTLISHPLFTPVTHCINKSSDNIQELKVLIKDQGLVCSYALSGVDTQYQLKLFTSDKKYPVVIIDIDPFGNKNLKRVYLFSASYQHMYFLPERYFQHTTIFDPSGTRLQTLVDTFNLPFSPDWNKDCSRAAPIVVCLDPIQGWTNKYQSDGDYTIISKHNTSREIIDQIQLDCSNSSILGSEVYRSDSLIATLDNIYQILLLIRHYTSRPVIIRLHPKDRELYSIEKNRKLLKKCVKRFPNVVVSEEETLENLQSDCFGLVVDRSSIGIEAILRGIPVYHIIKKNRPLSPYQDISLEEKDLLDNRTLISNTDRITYLEKIARQTWSNKEITSGQFLDTIHSWVFS